MKKVADLRVQVSRISGLFIFLIAVVATFAQSPEVLNNPRVTQLAALGISEQVLIKKIAVSTVLVDASQSALLQMKSSGVSEPVIAAMLDRARTNGKVVDGVAFDELVEIPEGSAINVFIEGKIPEKSKRPGTQLDFFVAEDLIVGGKVVVSKGTVVRAKVIDARKPGRLGRSGRLTIAAESTTTSDGQTLRLRGGVTGAYGDNFGNVLTLWITDGWGGVLSPKREKKLKTGTAFTVYANHSLWVRSASK